MTSAQRRGSIWALRIDWGPGYRVYYPRIGRECLLLLSGGDKRQQVADIQRPLRNLEDYRERTSIT